MAPARGRLSYGKRFHTVLATGQSTLQDETEAQSVMGPWRVGSHFDWDNLDVHLLDPVLKLQFHFRTCLGMVAGSLCPSSLSGHIE